MERIPQRRVVETGSRRYIVHRSVCPAFMGTRNTGKASTLYRGWCDTSWLVHSLGAPFQSNKDHEDPDMWLEAMSCSSFQESPPGGGRAGGGDTLKIIPI